MLVLKLPPHNQTLRRSLRFHVPLSNSITGEQKYTFVASYARSSIYYRFYLDFIEKLVMKLLRITYV